MSNVHVFAIRILFSLSLCHSALLTVSVLGGSQSEEALPQQSQLPPRGAGGRREHVQSCLYQPRSKKLQL